MTAMLEHFEYRLKEGTDEAAFLRASAGIDDWAARQPGFAYRSVARKPSGEWVDIIFWADEAALRAADARFGSENGQGAFVCMLDRESFRREALAVRSARPGAAQAA